MPNDPTEPTQALTDDPLAGMRKRVAAYEGSDHYRFTVDGIEYDGHWAHDARRALAEVDRLRTELTEAHRTAGAEHGRAGALEAAYREACTARDARDTEIARLRAENTAQAKQIDAVRKIQPQRRNSAMVTSEQLATMRGWNDAVDAIREALEPCTCSLTDPSTWETYGGLTEPGSTYQWEPNCPAHGDAPALDQSGEGQANG